MKRSPINRRGKKAKEWESAKREGDKLLAGVCGCEIRFNGCLGSLFLGRAHRKKRRFCDRTELAIFCVCCAYCHGLIEKMTHEQMFDIVDLAIRNRESNL